MPFYTYQCSAGHRFTAYKKIVDRNDCPSCECSLTTFRTLEAPMLPSPIATFQAFESPASGKLITSISDLNNDLKKTGNFLYEPGVKKQIAENKKTLIEKDNKIIQEGFKKTFSEFATCNLI